MNNNNQRPTRTRQPPIRLTYQQSGTPERDNDKQTNLFQTQEWIHLEQQHNIKSSDVNADNIDEYSADRANLIAQVMNDINSNVTRNGLNFIKQFGKEYEAQFSQQYIFEKGVKKFGERGRSAAEKELDQLHKRGCFQPIDVSTQTDEEKKKTQRGMMLLTEKNNPEKTVKGRLVYDGSKTRDWVTHEEAASPTVLSLIHI